MRELSSSVTPPPTPNLRGQTTLPRVTATNTVAVLLTNPARTGDNGSLAVMNEISPDLEMGTSLSLVGDNLYCETPALAAEAHATCSDIRPGSWCQLDQTPPMCYDTRHLCGCFEEEPREFRNPSGNCSVVDSHYFCQAEIRGGQCNLDNGPPYLCEGSDIHCACDQL